MTALLIKESVNQTVDNMGFYNSLQACFTLHQLNHSHWAEVHENKYPVAAAEDGIADWRNAPPVRARRARRRRGPAPGALRERSSCDLADFAARPRPGGRGDGRLGRRISFAELDDRSRRLARAPRRPGLRRGTTSPW